MQDSGAKASLSTVALRLQRRLSLPNSEHIHLQGIDFDVGRGKANVLPEYYRKPGSGIDKGLPHKCFLLEIELLKKMGPKQDLCERGQA